MMRRVPPGRARLAATSAGILALVAAVPSTAYAAAPSVAAVPSAATAPSVAAAGSAAPSTPYSAVPSSAASGSAAVPSAAHRLRARDDAYLVYGETRVEAAHGVLGNDRGRRMTVVSHTAPAHGTVALDPDGSFRYVPSPGFRGTDRFTYTITDAVRRYAAGLPPLATLGGVTVSGGGYGSSFYPVPGVPGEFYGLTDRGPNVLGPGDVRVEPLPDFTPSIGRFRFLPDRGTGDGRAVLERAIPLRSADGTPYNGRVNPLASTGEQIVDLEGRPLPAHPGGYDPEGLVATRDGGFWVSDEYGPFITRFDRTGRQIRRLSPFDGTLPAELANRMPNKGMEGLTITPDGETLVGIMQSALRQPDLDVPVAGVAPVRIVTHQLRTGATHEYLYLLDNPGSNLTVVSEIAALPDGTFLVIERDSEFPPAAIKRLWRIDLRGATDVGPRASVPGTVYHPQRGGLLVRSPGGTGSPAPPGGRTLEALVGNQDTATAAATLRAAGIVPVAKSEHLDVAGLLAVLSPAGTLFPHDKLEGVAVLDGGRTLVLCNDSDFGLDTAVNETPPYQLLAKLSPATGLQDDGAFLLVDLTRLPAATSTATVTVTVS